MSEKQTPKSCSCYNCKRGKHTKTGHFYMHKEEKTFRQKAKQFIRQGLDFLLSHSPKGNYFD